MGFEIVVLKQCKGPYTNKKAQSPQLGIVPSLVTTSREVHATPEVNLILYPRGKVLATKKTYP